MTKILAFACAMALFCTAYSQNVNAYSSKVTFKISNMKFKTVEGTFGGMKGSVNFTPRDLSSASMDVCIDASSVNTGNAKRDVHLRKEDFFHTTAHPEICFKSTKFVKSDNGYTVIGNLKMLGTSKAVSIPFTVENKVFKGTFTIQRLDYGLGKDTRTFLVGNEVEMAIICELQ